MLKGPFINSKLAFIISIGKQVEVFLKEYQTDTHMIPFLARDLGEVVRNCMQRFIKKPVLDEASTVQKLSRVDVRTKENQKNVKYVEVGFVAQSEIQDLLSKKRVSELQVLDFK